MDSGKNVTIYDIADRAGISASTVGAVMNGSWKARRISETTAENIKKLADEMGYSLNLQASALRRERSRIIGMILPMHDNRYFGSISQVFEEHARKHGLFPVISSTRRDPKIEEDAVRLLLNYQVESIVCTGATNPDAIADMCEKRGVRTYNIDLPGSKAPSIISNNFEGAQILTKMMIEKAQTKSEPVGKYLFVGGRSSDHNTTERMKGFKSSCEAHDIQIDEDDILQCGYAAEKAEAALEEYIASSKEQPAGIFVNSTISLEGVMNWFHKNGMHKLDEISVACFDWDPFAALMHPDITMVRQNVELMVSTLFDMITTETYNTEELIQIPPTIMNS